jgi:hypothetical protein
VVERSPEKAGVGGSTPSLATIIPKQLTSSDTFNPGPHSVRDDQFANRNNFGVGIMIPASGRNNRGTSRLSLGFPEYTILDENGNLVRDVTLVAEYFSDTTGTPPPPGQTWQTESWNLNYGNVANGQFIDNLGGCCYTATQSFTAQVGGISYVLSTTASMASYGFSSSSPRNAYNP